MKELICMVGLPRSGKSTWAKQQPWPIVNPDSIRLAMHGQAFAPQAERLVWAAAHLMVGALFLAGHEKVILDATNITRKLRAEWFSRKFRTTFKWISTHREVCIIRARDTNFPVDVIERMHFQWEPLGPDEPLFEESA